MTSEKMCPRCRVTPLDRFGRCPNCDPQPPQKEKIFTVPYITLQRIRRTETTNSSSSVMSR